ncbi:MAG: hypothetical protein RDU59_12935 [Thermodesulfobacteriota bacterium]|nr:hypothetical protein [Thermodesulfobacteriota bacterium]
MMITKAYERKTGGRSSSLRWLLAFLFPVGYVLTMNFFNDYALEYFFLTAVSLVACFFLFSVLKRPFIEHLPVWILFLVFWGAYYLKFYLMIIDPDLVYLLPLRVYDYFVSDEILLRVYTTTTLAFSTFCFISGTACLLNKKHRPQEQPAKPSVLSLYLSLTVALVLIGVSSLLTFGFDIVMGLQKQALPFRLEGLIVYLRLITIPIILILIIWGGFRLRRKSWTLLGTVVLILYGISDMLLRASKSTLFFLLIALGLLWLLNGGKIRAYHMGFGLIVGSFSLLLYPFIMALRIAQHSYPDNMIAALSTAMRSEILGSSSLLSMLGATLDLILMRISGSDILMALVAYDAEPLGWRTWEVLTGPRGFAGHLTVNVFGAPPEIIDAFGLAPSLVGFFFTIGGDWMVLLGMGLFTYTVLWAWRKLADSGLRSKIIAQVFLLMFVLSMAIDGVLDRAILHQLPVYVVTLFLCEWIMRLSDASGRRNRLQATNVPGGSTH